MYTIISSKETRQAKGDREMANKQDLQKCDNAIESLLWEETYHPGLFDTIAIGQTESQAQGKTEFTVVQIEGYWEHNEDMGASVARVDVVNREKAEKLAGRKFWFYGE